MFGLKLTEKHDLYGTPKNLKKIVVEIVIFNYLKVIKSVSYVSFIVRY